MRNVIMLCIKFIACISLLLSCTTSISFAQENKWPLSVYGGRGGNYTGAAKITGYITLNSKSLKWLVHRTYMQGSLFDTLLNNDTLTGRINLYILNNAIDVELSNANVVSIPCFYIKSIVGSSLPQVIKSLTTWVILSPKMYNPFGRLLAQKNDIFFYDNSQWDTSYHKYDCPMVLRNGHEEIRINSFFGWPRSALTRFIKTRYSVDLSKDTALNIGDLIDYVLKKESERNKATAFRLK